MWCTLVCKTNLGLFYGSADKNPPKWRCLESLGHHLSTLHGKFKLNCWNGFDSSQHKKNVNKNKLDYQQKKENYVSKLFKRNNTVVMVISTERLPVTARP